MQPHTQPPTHWVAPEAVAHVAAGPAAQVAAKAEAQQAHAAGVDLAGNVTHVQGGIQHSGHKLLSLQGAGAPERRGQELLGG